jgi:hypothetical protein
MIIQVIKRSDVSEVGSDALQAMFTDAGFDATQNETCVAVTVSSDDLQEVADIMEDYYSKN